MALPKIVHVEDDPDIREITLIALEMVGGLQVVQFASGHEALSGAADAKPDLFLLDVMMPEMSGEDVLNSLRSQPEFARTPVIFMTAKAQQTDLHRLLEAGAADVIVKPFDPMQLAGQIIAIWEKSRALH